MFKGVKCVTTTKRKPDNRFSSSFFFFSLRMPKLNFSLFPADITDQAVNRGCFDVDFDYLHQFG